jgi:hypothetical protein
MNTRIVLVSISIWLGLAFGLTVASLLVLRPADCSKFCDEPFQARCPPGTCRFGEQQAGFPLSMVRDQTASSPTGGWGRIDSSDTLLAQPFLLNLIFYMGLVGFAWQVALFSAKRASRRRLLLSTPLLAVSLIFLALGLLEEQSAPAQSLYPEGSPQAMLLGNWHSTAGYPYVFRFYENGRVSIKDPSQPSEDILTRGSYKWVGDQSLHMSFSSTSLPGESPCAHIIPLLRPFCSSQLDTPKIRSGYPAPEPVVSSLYPAPPLPVMEIHTIEADFQVETSANRLVLGSPQTGTTALDRQR